MQKKINSLSDTKALAERIAALVKTGDIITLQGDLGAGKTAFARFFIHSFLGGEVEVLSPTFNLVHPYEAKNFIISHFDLYRLKNAEDIEELGIYDAFDNGICLIEWPEIIDDILPKDRLLIKISLLGDQRVAELQGLGNWKARIGNLDA
jgi:tRNA threonylcarbamoyl adenosine modification protein YjeE